MSDVPPTPPAADVAPAATTVVLVPPTAAASPAATPPDAPAAPAATAPANGAPDAEAVKDAPEGGTEQPAKTGAPEEYADFTVPEGAGLDPELTGEFKTIAKELDLPQEAAQKVVELGLKLVEKAGKQHMDALASARTAWADETKADPEIGGSHYAANEALVAKAKTTFASPAMVTLLDQSGLGNHPEFFRMMAKIGAAISEDPIVTGGNNAPTGGQDTASKFYPSMAH